LHENLHNLHSSLHFLLSGFHLLIVGVEDYCWPWSHSSDTPESVRPLWLRDQPTAVASTCTKHNIHKRPTSMHHAGFELTTPASERSQSFALNLAPTGIGHVLHRWSSWEGFCRRG